MIRRRILLVALACCAGSLAPAPASAQYDRADIRYETVSPQSIGLAVTYRLPFRTIPMSDGTLIVSSREDYLQARELRSVSEPGVSRFLRRGDVITHVDGVRLDRTDAFERAMHSSGGRPRLTVHEAETGETADWTIEAARMFTPADRTPPPDRSPKADGIVRAILVAPTDDETIGDVAENTIARIRGALEVALPPDRLEIVTVSGDACDARGILRHVEQIVCRERDTLFVYVVARSGFDARYAVSEESPIGVLALVGEVPDDGQFFYLHEGDLLRRSLWERMATRDARLTILVTETGVADSVIDEATAEFLTSEAPQRSSFAATDPQAGDADDGSRRGWAERLLGTTGQIDVRVSSPNQTGWFDPLRGGWFADALLRSMEVADRKGTGDWNTVLESATKAIADRYAERRTALLNKAGGLSATAKDRLQSQAMLIPEIRTLAVEPDETLDHLPSASE